MKLYELTQNYQNLLDLIDNEEIEEGIIEKALNEVGDEFDVKAENICKVIKSLELEGKAIKEEEKRLSSRRKALENNISSLKQYLEGSMKAIGKEKIKGNVFTLSLQKNPPSANIIDLKSIPKEYFIELEPSLDKKTLISDLKEGKKIDGVELKQIKSLRIR